MNPPRCRYVPAPAERRVCPALRPVVTLGSVTGEPEALSNAHDSIKWARACVLQFHRWQEAWRSATRQSPPDRQELDRAYVEGHFLAVAGQQLVAALKKGPHADLLSRLPGPQYVSEDLAGSKRDGARYTTDVRHAHEHDDEWGQFARAYGFSHRWSAADSDAGGGSIGGLRVPEFPNAIGEIEAELDQRIAQLRG